MYIFFLSIDSIVSYWLNYLTLLDRLVGKEVSDNIVFCLSAFHLLILDKTERDSECMMQVFQKLEQNNNIGTNEL